MNVSRSTPSLLVLISLVTALAGARAHAQTPAPAAAPPPAAEAAPPPADEPAPARPPASAGGEAEAPAEEAAPKAAPRQTAAEKAKEREELKREVMADVERSLDETRREIREEVSYVEAAEDARSYDAKELEELKRTVNLLQLHGYWRTRVDLFNNASLGRGLDPTGNTLMPVSQGSNYLLGANMRLRLNPILRVSDDIAVFGQIDALDNVVLGSSPLAQPFWDATTPADVIQDRIAGQSLLVKRLWAEVETPIGQLAFGRMPEHFGEGMVYNDGNCLDCDYGNTFDRLQLALGPLLGGHLFVVAADVLSSGQLSTDSPGLAQFGNYGQPLDIQRQDDALRFSLRVSRIAPAEDVRRKLANGEWVVNYAFRGAYRTQEYAAPAFDSGLPNLGLVKPVARFGEFGTWFEVAQRKLRIAFEGAAFGGRYENRIGTVGAAPVEFGGQTIDFLQFAAYLRAQHSFLKQDSLLVELGLGFASGDDAPGAGVRAGRPGSGPEGNTAEGDIDGRQWNCTAASCADDTVLNFRMNPDFRIDQYMWRWLYTSVTDAWFVRAEGRFKPTGRSTGGGEDDGFEFSAAFIYSQAVQPNSTPSGTSSALGLEGDLAITYTSKDRFFLGIVGGFLFPLSGFDNSATGEEASFAQVYRGVFGVTF